MEKGSQSEDLAATAQLSGAPTGSVFKVTSFQLQATGATATVVLRTGGAAGTVLLRASVAVSGESHSVALPGPVPFTSGIHATIANGTVQVQYRGT